MKLVFEELGEFFHDFLNGFAWLNLYFNLFDALINYIISIYLHFYYYASTAIFISYDDLWIVI